MKSNFRYFIFLVMLIPAISCNKENAPDCFQSAGEVETERRSLGEFSEIEINDYILVELFDSTETFIEVTGPRNLLPEIITEVSDSRINIRNENSCNWVRSFKNKITVRIYAPSFPYIENFSTGGITSINTIEQVHFILENRQAAGNIELNLNVDTVTINTHTGVADVLLNGSTKNAYYFNQGYGWIDGRNLNAVNAYVNNSSINDVFVRASEYLFGVLYFSGNIYYTGDPDILDSDIQGSGQISPL